MSALLLDHPWGLLETLETGDGFRVLETFVDLSRRYALPIIQFVSRQEYNDLWLEIDHRKYSRTSGYAALMRFVPHLIRDDNAESGVVATPLSGPTDLPSLWKTALRESMGDLGDWRKPQIVVSEKRRPEWPKTHEVQIQCADQADLIQQRLLIPLENYESNPYVISDFDPWDLRHACLCASRPFAKHECKLPKPPKLKQVPFERLQEEIDKLRADDWRDGEKYYFIPPVDWRLHGVSMGDWHAGRIFRKGTSNGRTGPVDRRGIVWAWHEEECHWDVQLTEYVSINHEGDLCH